MLSYIAFQIGALLARYTPLAVSYAIARAIGVLTFYAWPGGRRRCIQNMLHVTGGDMRRAQRLARTSFANYLVYLVDFFRLTMAEPHEIGGRVRFDRWHEIETERRGNGVIFVTVHFGNWDLGAAALAQQGFPVLAIADTLPDARVDRRVRASREHIGLHLIPVGRAGPGMLRALRENSVLAILIDIPTPGGIEVEFFGAPVAVSDGPARIALRAGASVMAAVLPRLSPWSDTVGAEVVTIHYEPTGDTERDVLGLTQALFRQFEAFIRLHPEQWYIFRNLWPGDIEAPAQAVASARG